MGKFYLAVLLISSALFASAQHISVQGRVLDVANKEPLPGAIIVLGDSLKTTVTDANGLFQINDVAPGKYKLKIKFVGYENAEKEIKISDGQTVSISVSLSPKTNSLSEVNIFGSINKESEAAGRTSEKNANNITNVVTSQVMERSPDINAANVLQRVSGVTIDRNTGGDEAYAIIRGLEPRYNNTLINGVKVTSPDEKSRYVSLDIVPSDLLQRIEVSKSLLPEMEGDAIGGTVNLIFKDAPDSMLFKVTGQVGYNQIFIDRKYVTFPKQDIQ